MSAQLQGMLEDRIRRELPHLKEEDVRALTPIVERLIEAYQPERIYLFGSKARGDYGPDSDFDVLVVVPDTAPPHRKRSRLAYEVSFGGPEPPPMSWCGLVAHSRAGCTWQPRFQQRSYARGSCSMPPNPQLVAETLAWFAKPHRPASCRTRVQRCASFAGRHRLSLPASCGKGDEGFSDLAQPSISQNSQS